MTARVDVCIVGAGPTGLLAANMLGAAGLDVLLVERNPTTSSEAKAISLDDESLRTMARVGLWPWLQNVVSPGTGTRYYGSHGQLLCHARGPEPPLHGYAIKSPFAQPALEAALRDALGRFESVTARFGAEVTAVDADPDGVSVTVSTSQETLGVRASWLLGCDGGQSTVRAKLGIEMEGVSLRDRWIVIDTIEDPHTERYGMHVGDPRRPFVVIPAPHGRCRYEFLLGDEEGRGDEADLALVRSLLRPHRPITPEQIERTAIYRFHALVATRWRVGRCFLLGDAAHMMPPFAGQGLNSGVRDANNLVWKLVTATRTGSDVLLDSYELERRPHAQATVTLSRRLGAIVMTTDRLRATARDLLVGLAMSLPRARQYLEQMRFRPRQRYRSGLVIDSRHPADRVGTVVGQPRVLDATGMPRPLDELLGPGFALLAIGAVPCPPPAVETIADALGASRVRLSLDEFPHGGRWPSVADVDGGLRREIAGLDGTYLLIRPDRYVYSVFTAGQADQVLQQLHAHGLLGRGASKPAHADDSRQYEAEMQHDAT
jgi:3-(3-hydroxy-phenyl)propionate hydroxylase